MQSNYIVEILLSNELIQLYLNGILTDNFKLPQHIIAARTLSPILGDNHAFTWVMNISPEAVTIYKGTSVGNITPLPELLMADAIEQPVSHCVPLGVDSIDLRLSSDQQQELLALLHQFRDLFATKDQPLGQMLVGKHTVYTEDPPVHQPVCHQLVTLQDAIDEKVHRMLQQGVFRQSFSPWSSPVVMVHMKDGSRRFCMGYHKLYDVIH